ncbi:MAG: hypothetical protein IJP39_03125 [Bacteroidales bacterium]|nr:hypothetical protein [Bacteroidales bacterium]MBQ6821385.1 hypothetical protein [Bacteroidales bacterium]MBR0290632.1 hypothetical protein [Bacteroidales bacterium]
MKKVLACIVLSLSAIIASAQFRSEAFQQQYNDDKSSPTDSVDVMFSFKEYFAGLGHRQEIKIGTMFAGSMLVVGGEQIYNRQYWKLPIVYTGILAPLGAGIYLNTQGNHDAAKYCFIGAGLAYWGTLMDGVVSYRTNQYPLPGKATLYSLLLPGLGQAYNGEFWKIPIYIGGLGAAYYFYNTNEINYQRYRRIYKEATNTEVAYTGPITAEQALYYRDVFRRYRDYSILAMALVYLLQVIDANVFSYMHDFEIADDMALDVRPSVITPNTQLAFNPQPAFGLSVGLKF